MSLQTTLKHPVTCSGIGLHSGKTVAMRLLPAGADHGIVFVRSDVERKHSHVPARYDLVADTRMGTTLRNKHGVSIATVEHLMAALWGMGIDNAAIEIDAPEVPIMDGSSEPFIQLLEAAGVAKLSVPRRILRVLREVEVSEGLSTARVAPYEGEDFGCSLDIEIDFDHALIRRQRAVYDFSGVTFKQALGSARTFCFAHEVEALQAAGLARGGSLANAIVLGKEGILNEEGLRFNDEFLRHKALDCVGDLFLAPHRIEGAFTFSRPGHGINNKLLRALMADEGAWTLGTAAERTLRATTPEHYAYL